MDIGAHGKNDSAYLCWYGESRPNKGYFKATSGIWLVNEKKAVSNEKRKYSTCNYTGISRGHGAEYGRPEVRIF